MGLHRANKKGALRAPLLSAFNSNLNDYTLQFDSELDNLVLQQRNQKSEELQLKAHF